MSTDFTPPLTDAQLIYEYLGRRIEEGPTNLPAEEVVAELSDYGAQLARLREMVARADASLVEGKTAPLDLDGLLDRVRGRASTQERGE